MKVKLVKAVGTMQNTMFLANFYQIVDNFVSFKNLSLLSLINCNIVLLLLYNVESLFCYKYIEKKSIHDTKKGWINLHQNFTHFNLFYFQGGGAKKEDHKKN